MAWETRRGQVCTDTCVKGETEEVYHTGKSEVPTAHAKRARKLGMVSSWSVR